VTGRDQGGFRRPVRIRLTFALLVLCLLPVAATASATAADRRAHPARAPQSECRHGPGVAQRECPKLRASPHLISLVAGTPIAPVLVGNKYAIEGGRWSALRPLHLSFEWVDARGRRLSRAVSFVVTPALAGQVVVARICASTRVAANCLKLRLPAPVRTVAQYLQSSCGSHRPAPPAYDPSFVLLSAPQVGHGWNPCRVDAWAIDTYGEPPLATPGTSWEALIAQALAQASAATGISFARSLDFVAPPGARLSNPSGVTLAIGFGPQAPGIAGIGGPTVGAGPFSIDGSVELDSQKTWQAPEALTVLLHEIGHALGLGHPLPPPAPALQNEIMDSGNYQFTSYQAGDLCGLFEVTWQQPCAGAAAITPGQGDGGTPVADSSRQIP
jgi:hypothetical protein